MNNEVRGSIHHHRETNGVETEQKPDLNRIVTGPGSTASGLDPWPRKAQHRELKKEHSGHRIPSAGAAPAVLIDLIIFHRSFFKSFASIARQMPQTKLASSTEHNSILVLYLLVSRLLIINHTMWWCGVIFYCSFCHYNICPPLLPPQPLRARQPVFLTYRL